MKKCSQSSINCDKFQLVVVLVCYFGDIGEFY